MTDLLRGVRIVALEQYGAAPYGTLLLAELGADVVKIESPSRGGDVSRGVGPYFLGEGDSHFYQTFSKGKSSVALEIKTPEGRAEFEELVRGADAVVGNLRGDQPAKLKITYPDLRAVKPSIVCVHISAYGRENERAGWPGYDYLMQAEAGFMSMTGEPDAPPTRFGLSMVDYMTGAHMAVACLAAVTRARETGQGCDVDVSLFDSALHQLSYPAVWAMNGGHAVGRAPRGAHPSLTPSQTVKTKDGWALLMCQTQAFWELFCKLADCKALGEDPRFDTMAARLDNRAALSAEVDRICEARTTQEWTEILAGQVPFAPIYDLRQALDNPFVDAVGMRETVAHPDAPNGRLEMLAAPFRINGVRPKGKRAPKMGEAAEDIHN